MKRKIIIASSIVLIAVLALLVMQGLGTTAINPVNKYENVQQLQQSVQFKFSVPYFVLNNGKTTLQNINGQMIEIKNDTFTFRAAQFVNKNADISGNYDKYNTQKEYNVNGDTIIKYLKVRTNSTDMYDIDSAILNWNTDKIAYSLYINKNMTLDDVFGILGLSNSNLSEITNDAESKSTGNVPVGFREYQLDSIGCTIALPDTNSTVSIATTDNSCVTFVMKGEAIMSVTKNTGDIDTSKVNSVGLTNGFNLSYLSTNPFVINTDEYKDYTKLVENIENIQDSFKDSQNESKTT